MVTLYKIPIPPPQKNAQFLLCSNPKKEKKLKKEMADFYCLAASEFFSEDKDQVQMFLVTNSPILVNFDPIWPKLAIFRLLAPFSNLVNE